MGLAPRSAFLTALMFAHAAMATAQPAPLVPAKTTGTIDVTYEFTSTGKRGPSQDQVLVSKVWNVRRTATVSVQLVADRPSPLPQLAKLTGARADREKERQAAAVKAGKDVAPMMASAEAIMKKCGEDEACLAAEAMKMGAAMNPNQMATAKKSVDAAATMGDATFQVWRGNGSSATFTVTESMTVRDRDPLCMELAGGTCTTSTNGSASGPVVPPPGGKDPYASAMPVVELDGPSGALTLMLPGPAGIASVSVTTKSDRPREPGGTSKATRKLATGIEPFTVPCPGACRTLSGTKTVPMTDDLSGEPGTLTVTWTFKAQ